MAERALVYAPATIQAEVALEPTYNTLSSLFLLSHPEERSGLSEWVTRAAAKLPPDRARIHRMICSTFFGIESTDAPSFPALIESLAAQNASDLRDQMIGWVHEDGMGEFQPPEPGRLLEDRQAYVEFMRRFFAEKSDDKGAAFEAGLFEEAHLLLNDPPALQALIVSHLRWMWDEVMQPEWERVLPMLQEAVEAFRQLDLNHLTAPEAIRLVTGRDVSGIWEMWPEQIIFVPSAHIGPYLTRFDRPAERTSRVIFGARMPQGVQSKSLALDRSELLVWLSALADDTRLRILELLTQHEELCAQDVIEKLELSQSAASRHLRQLTATGYLIERRREIAKCYTLNPQRAEETLRALKRFLQAK